ncbi:MFS transporter [Bradyrhizobium sp. 5.13L]
MSASQRPPLSHDLAALPGMTPAVILGLAAFLTNFDVTAVIVGLPAIAGDLGLGFAGYAWVMDAYSLAFTGSLLIAGALCDRYGRRKAMLGGNLVFAAASVACGTAWDGLSLSLARALQGIGAAFVVTGGMALIATTYADASARTRAFSWLGVMSGVAMAVGPTVGGIVATWMGWRWIFLANVPLCCLAGWAIPHFVKESREAAPRSIDILGMALLIAALFAMIEALLQARSAPTLALVGCSVSLLLMAVFVVQQMRQDQPLFAPGIFLHRSMIGIAVLLAAVSVGYWALLVYLPPFLAAAAGLGTDAGGAAMLAATLPMLFIPSFGGRSILALGWRRHFALAMTISTIGISLLLASSLCRDQMPIWLIGTAMMLCGVGAALAHPQLSGAVVALAPMEQAGMASAVTIVVRQAGFAIGIAAMAALLGNAGEVDGYIWPFACATLASGLGVLAAIVLLPRRSPR